MVLIFSIFPFVGLLLSLALGPLLFPAFWHKHERKILLGWAMMAGAGFAYSYSKNELTYAFRHMLVHDYVPFMILTFTLFVVSHGMTLRIDSPATPFSNTLFLAIGGLLTNFIGTTGASLLLIRPFIHMNKKRRYQTHSMVFFIFIVSNIGGCLTPIGDPPLFLGYLRGVSFFWTFNTLLAPFLTTFLLLLTLYIFIDLHFYKKESSEISVSKKIVFHGYPHLIFMLLAIALIIVCGNWTSAPCLSFFTEQVSMALCVLQIGLIVLACLSWRMIIKEKRVSLHFGPVYEVGRVFLAIFIALIPVSALLKQGITGPAGPLLALTQTESPALIYFWLTGILSAFLDNAPTYLLFFDLAGGNAEILMTSQKMVLMAISLGAVFMGALTYIGNAPNFMVRAIAQQHQIRMPSFVAYMVWSTAILLPIFLGVSLWFLR